MTNRTGRVIELDVLRGVAIFGMVLSGSIAFGGLLPAWMYHAQVPPPLHQFEPTRAGITWVDLVFPFFLFCMGAAIPLSLHTQLERGTTRVNLLGVAGRRFFQLLFFALFSQHMKAWVLSKNPGNTDQVLSILAFVLLFGQLFDFKKTGVWNWLKWVKPMSYLLAGILLYRLPFHDGSGFDFYRSDIIIVVLANMAFFGTLIYLFTADHPSWRIAVLVIVAAVILSARETGDHVVKSFFNFRSIGGLTFDWAYKFYFLKYLFIIIPGSWAGELFLKNKIESKGGMTFLLGAWSILILFLLALLLAMLFMRNQEMLCWILWLALLLLVICRKYLLQDTSLSYVLARYGLFFLLIGLVLEPYEGGIKKDPSTFSYYFITTGYSFLGLVIIRDLIACNWTKACWKILAGLGKNPLVAYVAGSLLLLPLFALGNVLDQWGTWAHTPWQGLLKGIIFTAMVSALTLYFNQKKWIWRS